MLTKSESETIEFGREFAQKLKGGDVVLLEGDLGAGKTYFTKGIASYWDIMDVKSPTYAIVQEYKEEDICIYHFDLYRVNKGEFDLEFYDYLDQKNIFIVEWGEKLGKVPEDRKVHRVKLDILSQNDRKIDVELP